MAEQLLNNHSEKGRKMIKIGDTVIVTEKNLGMDTKSLTASKYIGKTGTVEARCRVYKGSWLVRFEDRGLASYMAAWIKKQ
jgi:hypothetical protein